MSDVIIFLHVYIKEHIEIELKIVQKYPRADILPNSWLRAKHHYKLAAVRNFGQFIPFV